MILLGKFSKKFGKNNKVSFIDCINKKGEYEGISYSHIDLGEIVLIYTNALSAKEVRDWKFQYYEGNNDHNNYMTIVSSKEYKSKNPIAKRDFIETLLDAGQFLKLNCNISRETVPKVANIFCPIPSLYSHIYSQRYTPDNLYFIMLREDGVCGIFELNIDKSIKIWRSPIENEEYKYDKQYPLSNFTGWLPITNYDDVFNKRYDNCEEY